MIKTVRREELAAMLTRLVKPVVQGYEHEHQKIKDGLENLRQQTTDRLSVAEREISAAKRQVRILSETVGSFREGMTRELAAMEGMRESDLKLGKRIADLERAVARLASANDKLQGRIESLSAVMARLENNQ